MKKHLLILSFSFLTLLTVSGQSFNDALKVLAEAKESWPTNAISTLDTLAGAIDAGQYGNLKESVPGNEYDLFMSDLYFTLGQLYYFVSSYDKALAALTAALSYNEAVTDKVYIQLGFTYRQLKDYENAMASYNKALELNPETTDPVNAYKAEIYMYMGNYGQAVSEAELAAKSKNSPSKSVVAIYLSRAYLAGKHYKKAVDAVDYAFKHYDIHPNIAPQLYAVRGEAFLQQDNLTKAKENAAAGIKINKNAFDILFLEALIAEKENNTNEALQKLSAIIDNSFDRFYIAYRKRAFIYAVTGAYQKALADLESYTAAAPATPYYYDAEFYTARAVTLAGLNRKDEARAARVRAVELSASPESLALIDRLL